MNKIKTGIFSGSFNPIHIGHLALANYLIEFEGLDELWFIVTPQNPLKPKHSLLNDKLRIEMVKLAIESYPRFSVNDIESHLPQPSYTVRTLEALEEKHPDREFHLIIGADNWEIFDKWAEYEKIKNNYHIIVYPRRGHDIKIADSETRIKATDAPLIEVSSTFIRHSIAKNKDVRFFTPNSVYKYISDNKLYRD